MTSRETAFEDDPGRSLRQPTGRARPMRRCRRSPVAAGTLHYRSATLGRP